MRVYAARPLFHEHHSSTLVRMTDGWIKCNM